MLEWNYQSKEISSNGYEDIVEDLNKVPFDQFNRMSATEQNEIVDDIVLKIREKNIFPITYYNEEGIILEIKKCINKNVCLIDNKLNFQYNQGQGLCRFLFPNMQQVKAVKDTRTMWNKFYDDHLLKRALKFILKDRKVTPSNIYSGMRLVGGANPVNFSPMKAKALYEKYCPKNGIIYDFASGFGGRMLGALTSKNNYKYVGVEPNTETFYHLKELRTYIEKATNRSDICKLFCVGSEDFSLPDNSIDFAFSSPPYFNCETYSNESTQSYIKYNDVDSWFNEYVKRTIENIYSALKPNRYYAVNIADFNLGGNSKFPIHLVDRWKQISIDVGFVYVEEVLLKLQPRRQKAVKKQEEGIFVFKKL